MCVKEAVLETGTYFHKNDLVHIPLFFMVKKRFFMGSGICSLFNTCRWHGFIAGQFAELADPMMQFAMAVTDHFWVSAVDVLLEFTCIVLLYVSVNQSEGGNNTLNYRWSHTS